MFHFPQPFLGWTNTPHSLGYTFPQYSLWTPLPIFFFFLLFANKSQMRGNRKKKKGNRFNANKRQTKKHLAWAHWTVKWADLSIRATLASLMPHLTLQLQAPPASLASGGENESCLLIFYLVTWTTGLFLSSSFLKSTQPPNLDLTSWEPDK